MARNDFLTLSCYYNLKQITIFFRKNEQESRYFSRDTELIVCKNFKLVRKLGTGAFGEIYLAENRTNTSEKLAAKLE